MKIQVTLYATGGEMLTREIVDVDDDKWDEMDFLDKEKVCTEIVQKSLHWHWRELAPNETIPCQVAQPQ